MIAKLSGVVWLTALVLTALVPGVAGAATVQVVEDPTLGRATLTFEAAAGERNSVTVTLASQDPDGNRYSVTDTGANVTPGNGCSGGGAAGTPVTCLVPRSRVPVAPAVIGLQVSLSFALADGADRLEATALPADDGGGGTFGVEATGGDGVDAFLTGPEVDRIDPGGEGDDVSSGAGSDFVDAGASSDGPDRYDLGPGNDTLSYALRTEPVTVDLKDPGNSGAAGEKDNVLSAERVAGGRAADRLAGTDAENPHGGLEAFYGGGGADVLIGRGGRDFLGAAPLTDPDIPTFGPSDDPVTLRGGAGADFLSASGGADIARGGRGGDGILLGAGDDRAGGGRGRDTLLGEEGADLLRGGRGRDRLDAALFMIADDDGAVDRLNCGRSRRDSAVSVEPQDQVRNCEQVQPIDA